MPRGRQTRSVEIHLKRRDCLSVVIGHITWFPIPFPLAASSQVSPEERRTVHFPGPLPLANTDEVFGTLCGPFSDRLKRIPDGETGPRQGPTHWQTQVFEQAGLSHFLKAEALANTSRREAPLPEVSIDPSLELDTRYGHYANASFKTFSQHKAAGTIPAHVKLQVSSPLPKTFVVDWIKPEYQGLVEVQYEAAIVRALRTIQDKIPHHELAIQVECQLSDANDTAELVRCAAKLAEHVAADVDLGFYITSIAASTPKIVDLAIALRRQCSRPIAWLHLSLPSNGVDQTPFTALQRLGAVISDYGTELVLGLVQPRDEEGSRRRLRHAVDCLGGGTFGIAPSGNLADLSQGDFSDVLRILKALSENCE